MIYHHNQLMKDEVEATLFAVTNPVPFTSYEDHETAIYLRLYELVEDAEAAGEHPLHLIEGMLEEPLPCGEDISQLADVLYHSGPMSRALGVLQEHWAHLDPEAGTASRRYRGASQTLTEQVYAETTLRSYLETLATRFNA